MTVTGGSYTGGKYDVSNTTIGGSGSGNPLAAVFINNAYCPAAGCSKVDVTFGDNAQIVYSEGVAEGAKHVAVMTASGDGVYDISVSGVQNSDVYTYYNGTASTISINGIPVDKA